MKKQKHSDNSPARLGLILTGLLLAFAASAGAQEATTQPAGDQATAPEPAPEAPSPEADAQPSTTDGPAADAGARPAAGDEETPATTTQPAGEGAQAVAATVVEASGPCRKRKADQPWQPIAAGDKLDELTIIATGFGGRLVLDIANRATLEITSPTTIGISQLQLADGKLTSEVGLKYGSVRADVQPIEGVKKSDLQVVTPVATASVTGTRGAVGFTGDSGMRMQGTRGTWLVRAGLRRRNIKPGQGTTGTLTPPRELALQSRNPQLGDVHGGLNDTEQTNLRDNGGGRGVFGFTGGRTEQTSLEPTPSSTDTTSTDLDPPGPHIQY